MPTETDTGTIHVDEEVAEGFLRMAGETDSTRLSTVHVDDVRGGWFPLETVEGSTSGSFETVDVSGHAPFVGSPLAEGDIANAFPGEEAQIRVLGATARPGFAEWLSSIARGLARPWVVALAATQLNLARLSLDDLRTAGVEVHVVAHQLAEERGIRVSLSPGLIMSREEVRATSLPMPSGVKLTWMAMLSDDIDPGQDS